MTTHLYQTRESRLQAESNTPIRRQLENDLYAEFLRMREFLEEYASAWYSDELRERADAVAQRLDIDTPVS